MMVNNCSMTVNYHGILTLEIIGFLPEYFTMVNYHGIFITLAPGLNMIKKFYGRNSRIFIIS
jgi:hypothetical protein